MKPFYFSLLAFLLLSSTSYSQTIDIHKAIAAKTIEVYNRQLTLIDEKGYQGIRLSKDYGEGIAWLKGIEFSNGIIEFDVRGEDIQQHSFVGIAFHAMDNETFDAVYLRPFQFRSQDSIQRSHQIQYISLPNFGWRVLRAQFPGKYESAIDQFPAPDPNSWVRVKIVIQDATISTYINGSSKPSLVVQKVTGLSTGMIGFYVADTSGGDFANITITKTK